VAQATGKGRSVPMGFLDKVKSAAQDVAQEAKKATATGKSKMEQSQIRKRINDAAEKLGYLIYRERTQGIPAAEADQLVAEMTSLEAQLEEEVASQQAAAASETAETAAETPPAQTETPPASTSSSEPTSGDFKL
ncbi:MAG: hypothetical protein ACRDJI_02485, partial [Actinomycetota bacterium]